MEIDETGLIEFFGVPPTKVNEDEKEFFGSTNFEVQRGVLSLSVTFFAYAHEVDMTLTSAGKQILQSKVSRIKEVRLRDGGKSLILMRSANGTDTEKQVARISIDPLGIVLDD